MVDVAHDHNHGRAGHQILFLVLGGVNEALLNGDHNFLLDLAAQLFGDERGGIEVDDVAQGGHDPVLNEALDHLGAGLLHTGSQLADADLVRNEHLDRGLPGDLLLQTAHTVLLLLTALIAEGAALTSTALTLIVPALDLLLTAPILLPVLTPLVREGLQMLVVLLKVHIAAAAGVNHLLGGYAGSGPLGRSAGLLLTLLLRPRGLRVLSLLTLVPLLSALASAGLTALTLSALAAGLALTALTLTNLAAGLALTALTRSVLTAGLALTALTLTKLTAALTLAALALLSGLSALGIAVLTLIAVPVPVTASAAISTISALSAVLTIAAGRAVLLLTLVLALFLPRSIAAGLLRLCLILGLRLRLRLSLRGLRLRGGLRLRTAHIVIDGVDGADLVVLRQVFKHNGQLLIVEGLHVVFGRMTMQGQNLHDLLGGELFLPHLEVLGDFVDRVFHHHSRCHLNYMQAENRSHTDLSLEDFLIHSDALHAIYGRCPPLPGLGRCPREPGPRGRLFRESGRGPAPFAGRGSGRGLLRVWERGAGRDSAGGGGGGGAQGCRFPSRRFLSCCRCSLCRSMARLARFRSSRAVSSMEGSRAASFSAMAAAKPGSVIARIAQGPRLT